MKKYIALITLTLMCSCQFLPSLKPQVKQDLEQAAEKIIQDELAFEESPIPISPIA